jgi:hypothetical protein
VFSSWQHCFCRPLQESLFRTGVRYHGKLLLYILTLLNVFTSIYNTVFCNVLFKYLYNHFLVNIDNYFDIKMGTEVQQLQSQLTILKQVFIIYYSSYFVLIDYYIFYFDVGTGLCS